MERLFPDLSAYGWLAISILALGAIPLVACWDKIKERLSRRGATSVTEKNPIPFAEAADKDLIPFVDAADMVWPDIKGAIGGGGGCRER